MSRRWQCVVLLQLLCAATAMSIHAPAPAPAPKPTHKETVKLKKHLGKAIDKGDVNGAEKDLNKLEHSSAEQAANTEKMVMKKVAKETKKIKKARDAAHKTGKDADSVEQKRKANPALKPTKKMVKKTKAAIRKAKVADAQRAVARLSRKDAESQVEAMHEKEMEEEEKVKAVEANAAKQKAKGDAAVTKLSKELNAEKQQVQAAKKEAKKDMKKSAKVDSDALKADHLTKKQIKVKKLAVKHVAKAKARVARGYTKMKNAEQDAAKKVHKYQRVKQNLLSDEAKEMKSKQVEAQKLQSLEKAKEIERKQEAKLKTARDTAAKATRHALHMAFGKPNGPIAKELSAALHQEKAQAKEIASLQSLENHGFKPGPASAPGGDHCSDAADAAAAYEACFKSCSASPDGWFGKVDSCSCWKCRAHLDSSVLAGCSCDTDSADYKKWCPKYKAKKKQCTSKCVDESERCMCGHTSAECCEKHSVHCKSGFFFSTQCALSHPIGYVCNTNMTGQMLALVIVVSILMASSVYGCVPTIAAWYCCIRPGSQCNWLLGGQKGYEKDDGL